MCQSFSEHCLSASHYHACLKANKKLTQAQSKRYGAGIVALSSAVHVDPQAKTEFTPVPREEKEEKPGQILVKLKELGPNEANKAGYFSDERTVIAKYINDLEVQTVAEFLAVSKNMEWVSDQPLWFMTSILEKALDKYDQRHEALMQQQRATWEKKIREGKYKEESQRDSAQTIQGYKSRILDTLLPRSKADEKPQNVPSSTPGGKQDSKPAEKPNDVPATKFNVARYFTSGQFWVGLLLALGLVLLCMPFAAPVVFPVLGLAAFVSSAAGTIALEAFIAAVCGFGIFQLLWKFGDYFSLAQKLQKIGQWMEKWIKRLVYLLTAGVSTLISVLLAGGQMLSIYFGVIGEGIFEKHKFLFGWNLVPAFFLTGILLFVACAAAVFAVTVSVGLSALAITGVGLVLEALGWIFARPLKWISENPENSFLRNIKNWVCYLIAFPFFQLQKLGKSIAELAFTVFMSVYADFGGFGLLFFNMVEASEREKQHARKTGQRSNEPFRVYPLPYLPEEELLDLARMSKGWKALDHSSSEHLAAPLAEIPQAAKESSQSDDTHWVSPRVRDLVQSYSEGGIRTPVGAM